MKKTFLVAPVILAGILTFSLSAHAVNRQLASTKTEKQAAMMAFNWSEYLKGLIEKDPQVRHQIVQNMETYRAALGKLNFILSSQESDSQKIEASRPILNDLNKWVNNHDHDGPENDAVKEKLLTAAKWEEKNLEEDVKSGSFFGAKWNIQSTDLTLELLQYLVN